MRKIVISLLTGLTLLMLLTACGTKKPDHTTATAESALNKGKDITGKTVPFKVNKLAPTSAFRYNMESGKHLNFINSENPKVSKNDTVTIKVKKYHP